MQERYPSSLAMLATLTMLAMLMLAMPPSPSSPSSPPLLTSPSSQCSPCSVCSSGFIPCFRTPHAIVLAINVFNKSLVSTYYTNAAASVMEGHTSHRPDRLRAAHVQRALFVRVAPHLRCVRTLLSEPEIVHSCVPIRTTGVVWQGCAKCLTSHRIPPRPKHVLDPGLLRVCSVSLRTPPE